jgi:hypothetical protein
MVERTGGEVEEGGEELDDAVLGSEDAAGRADISL